MVVRLSGSALKVVFADEEPDFIGYISDRSTDPSARTQEDSRIGRVSRAQASSIEDKFVDAVRDALETALDWSAEPVTILRRTVQGHIEMVKFDDSSYMSRAAYDLLRTI